MTSQSSTLTRASFFQIENVDVGLGIAERAIDRYIRDNDNGDAALAAEVRKAILRARNMLHSRYTVDHYNA